MSAESTVYLVGLVIFIGLSIITMRSSIGSFYRLLSGLGITVFGTFWGIDIGNILTGIKFSQELGQSFIVFISVLGGGIVSAACSELTR